MSDAAPGQGELSTEEFNDLLTFDGSVQGYPTTTAVVVRDDPGVLVYANRSRNADKQWEIRSYRILGDSISFTVTDVDRASVAAILVEEFDPDALTIDDRHMNQQPVRHGVPVAVALDGRPAICAWLYARHEMPRDEVAELMDVGRSTVSEYLSRFRCRGTGLQDDLEVPDIGAIVPRIPPRFDPTIERKRPIADGGAPEGGNEHCPACRREADAMGILDNGDLIYLHGSSYCLEGHDDPHGVLEPAVDQLEAHKEADRDV